MLHNLNGFPENKGDGSIYFIFIFFFSSFGIPGLPH